MDRPTADRPSRVRARWMPFARGSPKPCLPAARPASRPGGGWRASAVATQRVLAAQLDLAVRNARVLASRARRAVVDLETVPDELVAALRTLAATVRQLNLSAHTPASVASRASLLHAARLRTRACAPNDRCPSPSSSPRRARWSSTCCSRSAWTRTRRCRRSTQCECGPVEPAAATPTRYPSYLTNLSVRVRCCS
jgi:hypothetical protein